MVLLLSILLSGCTGEKTEETKGPQKEAVVSTVVQNPISIDLSKIKIYPRDGEYLSSGDKKIAVFGANKETTYVDAKILLLNYSLNYVTLQKEDICLPYSANPGDSGIVLRGILKNEYDRDYWITLGAEVYDSDDNSLGHVLDSGPICGIIARYVESNKTETFELHFKYNNTISKINLSGEIGDVAPP